MGASSRLQLLKRWSLPRVALVGALGLGGPVLLGYTLERFSGVWGQSGTRTLTGPAEPFAQIESPGLVRPPVTEASRATLRDDEVVIGVVVGGRPRAYRLDAFRDRTRHVVNDLVNGRPVSVTFCDITDCVRVYTDSHRDTPLPLGVGGLYIEDGSQMVLKLDGKFFFQKSGRTLPQNPEQGSIPLDIVESTRISWKDWHAQHPDTDVYQGDPGPQDR